MSSLASSWQHRNWRTVVLTPLMLLYAALGGLRRGLYRVGALRITPAVLPVVVVGNLTVGGTGKSPLVGHLVALCRQRGWQPGIVSRGYGGTPQRHPLPVTRTTSPAVAGDEAVMHARLTNVPVAVCVRRARAANYLAQVCHVDIVIADDGLQHAAMARHAEIVVVDASRGFGNGWQLPAGPLREPASRLASVDLVALQTAAAGQRVALTDVPGIDKKLALLAPPAGCFHLEPRSLVNLATRAETPLHELAGGAVHAVAGLGHPKRFFDSLAAFGFEVRSHAFADHHPYTAADLQFDDKLPVLVTSKDAVKIEQLALPLQRFYEVQTALVVDAALAEGLTELLDTLASRLHEPKHV